MVLVKMTELDERALTDDVWVVTYTGSAQRGDDPTYEALMSSTYVRRDGQWRLFFHQQTPLV